MKLNRKLVKRVFAVLASMLLLALLGLGYADWQWNRVVVTVVNQSSQAVDGVEINLNSGGRYALGRLLPGQSRSVRVFPGGEDAGTLTFSNAAGQIKKTDSVAYIEPSGGYRLRLKIIKNDAVVCEYKNWPHYESE